MKLTMKGVGTLLLFGVMLMSTLSLLAAPQSKGRGRAPKSGGKDVTVTLVRWPYT